MRKSHILIYPKYNAIAKGASGSLRIYLTASTMARNSPMLFVLLPMELLKSSNPEERSTSPL